MLNIYNVRSNSPEAAFLLDENSQRLLLYGDFPHFFSVCVYVEKKSSTYERGVKKTFSHVLISLCSYGFFPFHENEKTLIAKLRIYQISSLIACLSLLVLCSLSHTTSSGAVFLSFNKRNRNSFFPADFICC